MARTITTKSGRALTAADIERLADQIEREDFDLSTWVPRPGRPSLDPTTNSHAPRIAVRVPESLRLRVASRAAAEGRTVSQVVRVLLERYVEADR
jgi:predicted DNA binding CopG/RHH family protein